MGDFLSYEQDGAVVTLTMNRPDLRNTLSGEGQHTDFIEACARIEDDESVRCVILTGAGSAFSAGGNVKDMRDRKGLSAGTPYQIRNNYRREIQRIPVSLYNLNVPTIAAVNGPAIGAGCDLATMCDIRIASDRAKFAESFVRLGIIPGDGGAWLLPRIVGMAKAAELAFTGDTIDAEEALACGLASKIVPHDTLMDAARDLAGRIARNPAHALRMTKKLLREAQFSRLETLLEMSAAFQALAHHDPAHDEAVNALIDAMEKRQAEKKTS
jgi:enoyl-CoA hydratase/carnithine racemase